MCPAVSLQMQRLEDRLGRPLFVREGAGLRLTEHGVMLRGHWHSPSDLKQRLQEYRSQSD